MSHARLEHLYRKDLPRGFAESEAELSTYLVGAHFGFDLKEFLQRISRDGWMMPKPKATTLERRTSTG